MRLLNWPHAEPIEGRGPDDDNAEAGFKPFAFMRCGNADMMTRRSASLRLPHRAISSSVRPQPAQSAVALSMAHTFVQGDEIIQP
jgi:hypothetical protein